MITKVIHYCWFGGKEKTKLVKKCISSWKKYCPDYEIKEWNESNYNVRKNKFISDAYDNKKWAFVSDYARLDIIYNNGGIYLDTDVELIKSLDELLNYDLFIGFEPSYEIDGNNSLGFGATGLGFGAIAHNKIIKDNLDAYKNIRFPKKTNALSEISCPKFTSKILVNYGFKMKDELQVINKCVLLSSEYLCPLNYDTKKLTITNKTISIHWYGASWISSKDKLLVRIKIYIKKIIGNENYNKIKNVMKR